MTQTLVAVAFRIEGRVQGVGFRYFTTRAAAMHGVRGWVRNLPDGAVEAHALATDAQMAAFRGELATGPAYARVDRVIETALEVRDLERFVEFQVVRQVGSGPLRPF